MKTEEELREKLTSSQEDFDDIILGRKLGANSNIHSIIVMLRDIADQLKKQKISCQEGRRLALELTGFFDRMRGDSTIAVRNAIHRLTGPLKGQGCGNGEALAAALLESCSQYEKDSSGWNKKVLESAGEILKGMDTMMVYDYSSSVDQILSQLAAGTPITVYVPESRTLNGGMPFVRNHKNTALFFHVIPDCAMAYYLPKCQAALVGVETFLWDGGLYNTTGSLLLAIACKEYGVPFYGVAQMIKCSREMSEKQGNLKTLEEFEMVKILGLEEDQEQIPNMDAVSVGIEFVPFRYVTGYMTEAGYLTPEEVKQFCGRGRTL